MRLVIDAGHGGQDDAGNSSWGGVRGPGGTLEKDVTLALAERVAAHLGSQAILTRSRDTSHSFAERTAVARTQRADAFISLHANAGDVESRGAEIFVHSHGNARCRHLGNVLGKSLGRAGLPISVPCVQTAPLAVLDPNHHVPGAAACLLEVDYLTNHTAERQLRDPRYLDHLGRSLAYGLREYGAMPIASALTVSVPWTGDFRITIRLPKTRVFTVTRGSVTVEASASWDGTRPIPLPSKFTVTLWRSNWGPDDNMGSRDYPTNGKTTSAAWNDLSSADYYLEIYVPNSDPWFHLNGTVSVT